MVIYSVYFLFLCLIFEKTAFSNVLEIIPRQGILEEDLKSKMEASSIQWSEDLEKKILLSPCVQTEFDINRNRVFRKSILFLTATICWCHHRYRYSPTSLFFIYAYSNLQFKFKIFCLTLFEMENKHFLATQTTF